MFRVLAKIGTTVAAAPLRPFIRATILSLMKLFRWAPHASVAVASATIAAFAVWIEGTVVVVDEADAVISAAVTNGSDVQRLYDLPGGILIAIPQVEGVVEVRCRDGSIHPAAYVTHHMHTRVKVVGNGKCEQVINVI